MMRIDKFLKVSRLIKRRTVAKEACEQGMITVNGKTAKPGTDLKIGDVIQIEFGNSRVKAKIRGLDQSCKKEDAASLYEIVE